MKPVKMVDLYSYWMTTHFLLYKIVNFKIISPYPSILLGFFVQLYIFYMGRHTMRWQFIIAVFIWKLSMLILTPYNMNWNTILFNLALFFVYLIVIHIRGVSLKYLYSDAIYKTEQSHKTLADFIRFRITNIF